MVIKVILRNEELNMLHYRAIECQVIECHVKVDESLNHLKEL